MLAAALDMEEEETDDDDELDEDTELKLKMKALGLQKKVSGETVASPATAATSAKDELDDQD